MLLRWQFPSQNSQNQCKKFWLLPTRALIALYHSNLKVLPTIASACFSINEPIFYFHIFISGSTNVIKGNCVHFQLQEAIGCIIYAFLVKMLPAIACEFALGISVFKFFEEITAFFSGFQATEGVSLYGIGVRL